MDVHLPIIIFSIWLVALGGLLRLGLSLATTIFLVSLGFSFSWGRNSNQVFEDIIKVTTNPEVYSLIAIVTLIFLLSDLLKSTARMEKISNYLKVTLKDPRLVMIAVPGLVGLIPMPGGAMFTAPITEEMGNEIQVSSEDKVFSNYWFRHCWELAFPLYPGIILAAGILKLSPNNLASILWPLALTAFLSGFLLSWKRWKISKQCSINTETSDINFFVLWPILIVILLAILKIPLIPGLVVVNILLAFSEKVRLKIFINSVLKALNWPIILLIWCVFFFGEVLTNSGFLNILGQSLIKIGTPLWLLSFCLPFIFGLLTGVTTGFVGPVFPLLLPLWKENIMLWAQFAYASGLAGVFLSPSHLCLSLTQEFFHADLKKVLLLVCIPVTSVLTVAVIRIKWGF